MRTQEDADTITAADARRVAAVSSTSPTPPTSTNSNAALPDGLDAVVNNAGIVVSRPIETVTS